MMSDLTQGSNLLIFRFSETRKKFKWKSTFLGNFSKGIAIKSLLISPIFKIQKVTETAEQNASRCIAILDIFKSSKGYGHLESKSAQRLVLLKLLILLVNIYMVDIKYKYLSCQRKSSKRTSVKYYVCNFFLIIL